MVTVREERRNTVREEACVSWRTTYLVLLKKESIINRTNLEYDGRPLANCFQKKKENRKMLTVMIFESSSTPFFDASGVNRLFGMKTDTKWPFSNYPHDDGLDTEIELTVTTTTREWLNRTGN